MAHADFVIPASKGELLQEGDSYFVRDVYPQKNLLTELKNAKVSLRDEGVEYIFQSFDIYYSVIHHGDSLPIGVLQQSYEDLHRAVGELNRALGLLLEDKDSLRENEELKSKYGNILKMLVYVYVQTVMFIEGKNEMANKVLGKGRKASKTREDCVIDKKNILLNLNNIVQRDIGLFWDPPIVEESFINLVSEAAYIFLQSPSVKSDKETRAEIFNLIGTLIKMYNHGTTFVIRAVQLIKLHEHLVQCFPEGFQILVEGYNCKGIVHELVREITEWQVDEKYEDNQGTRYCASALSSMAALMPDLMIPELLYLNRYLDYDSASLRISVLTVIVEVLMKVLTDHTLTEEQKESRDDFLSILMDHMNDISALVRTKVIQHWAKLQIENAIPIKFVNTVLERVIDHLDDKAVLVRKAAINCVTTFLSHNAFSRNLSLNSMETELKHKEGLLQTIMKDVDGVKAAKLEAIQKEWDSFENDLLTTIKTQLEQEKDDEEKTEEQQSNNEEAASLAAIPKHQVADVIRLYLNEKKYKDAFKLIKSVGQEFEEFQQMKDSDEEREVEIYMYLLHSMFVNTPKIMEELRSGVEINGLHMTEDDFAKLEALENKVDFYRDAVEFLKLVDSAIPIMIELLETTAISDMHEAVQFFTSAYQFNIDNAAAGILAMLKLMQRNEQERKDYIVNAFNTIYLTTDSRNLIEHTTTIVTRLVNLLKTVPMSYLDDLELIISEWVTKGILDNSVIDMLWQFFIKKMDVSDEDSLAAAELLRMAAMGRRSIITKNIKLVATVATSERGKNCMIFLGSCCEFLAVAGKDKIDITSASPPFKLKVDDVIFKDLVDILCEKFFEPVEYYNKAIFGGISFIYKLCSKPELICENLLTTILEKLPKVQEMSNFLIIRTCQLLGWVALKHMEYLDETIYRELKRRNNVREERKEVKKPKQGKQRKDKVRASVANKSSISALNESLNNSVMEESTLQGVSAEDKEAEFILGVLENDTVGGSGGLAKVANIVISICEQPDVYDDVMLQGTAVIALIRFMLVSSKFCSAHIRLLFTIFEKTSYPEIQCNILLHLNDLLMRFPNLIDPWTPKIFARLNDPQQMVRKITFFTLSNLILRDMVRAHSHLSEMVCCLLDEDAELVSMCRTFLMTLAQKENHLYSLLPDVFSHLMEKENAKEDDVKNVMIYMFELVGKDKYMENLVDRFCVKFHHKEDINYHRLISYCLSLVQYNDKALSKLQENFLAYKHLVHDPEVYTNFKNIMQNCSKQQVGKTDLKPLVTELEKMINSVFEINEDGSMKPPPVPKKKVKSRSGRGRKKTRKNSSSDEDD